MAGIYIHIPYCRKACSYCNFHFSTRTISTDRMVQAIGEEIVQRKNFLADVRFQTLYFGGGTPSVLSIHQIETIIAALRANLKLNIQEFTFEINPNDASTEYLSDLKKIGVDRLSIGVQSFSEKILTLLGRNHTRSQAMSTLECVNDLGFQNFSTDLIYGIPSQTTSDLEDDLKLLFHYRIPHLSAYALTIEEKTAWHRGLSTKKYLPVNDTHQKNHFDLVVKRTRENGFIHYEVSSFAQEKQYARHNSSYWNRTPYLGLGPSAHSFDGKNTRSWNVSHNLKYLASPEKHRGEEILTHIDTINEILMLGLRTRKGVHLETLWKLCTPKQTDDLREKIQKHRQLKNIYIHSGYVMISDHALFQCDGISSDLFFGK